jgi:hypothetical protein
MEKIRWKDRVTNEVLQMVKEERNILKTIKRNKAKWTCQFLRRNHLLIHVMEGKTEERIEMTERRERRKQYWMTLRKRQDTDN